MTAVTEDLFRFVAIRDPQRTTEAAGIWTIQSGTGMLKGLRGTRGHMARV
jgi:hypothetical protein